MEIGDYAVFHRTDYFNILRITSEHYFSGFTDGINFTLSTTVSIESYRND